MKGAKKRATRRVAAMVVAGVVAAATVGTTTASTASAKQGAKRKVAVVAAFYPLAFVADQVGGKRVVVSNLTPAGAEPHDLELTTDQRDAIEDATLVIVMGSGFQPAVETAARSRDKGTLEVLKRLPIDAAGKRVADDHDDEDGDDHADEDEADVLDPHVWLDPRLMQNVVDEVAAALSAADRKHRAAYEANAADLTLRLAALHDRYTQGLADCDRRLLVTAHEAFGYLAAAYDLRQEGVTGLSPDVEPNPRRLAALTDLVAERGVTTIFTEELVSPRIAQTLAREAGGLRIDTLNPLEGLTPKEAKAGDDYFSVMDRNLDRIRRALGCR